MRVQEIIQESFNPPVDEGWKETVAAGTLAAGMAMGGGANAANTKSAGWTERNPAKQTTQQVAPTKQSQYAVGKVAASPVDILKTAATKAGIKGTELTQFLAQCAHETLNFTHMEERGKAAYFAKKYEEPRKAKILGNKVKGDGERFKGRGFIQLTGRDNYTRAGKALGLPLDTQPELAARPDVAAKVAVWYWQNRVAPKIRDFGNVNAVTKKINPGMKGATARQQQFAKYAALGKNI